MHINKKSSHDASYFYLRIYAILGRIIMFVLPSLAQLVRAQSLYLWGPWFESRRMDYIKNNNIKPSDTSEGFMLLYNWRIFLWRNTVCNNNCIIFILFKCFYLNQLIRNRIKNNTLFSENLICDNKCIVHNL